MAGVTPVGTPGMARGTVSGGTQTGSWGTGQVRTAGDLLVAVVSAAGSTQPSFGTVTGWTQQVYLQGTNSATALYTKTATGSDAAWAESVTFGTGGIEIVLYEFTGANTSSPIDTSGTVSFTVGTNPAPVTSGNVSSANEYGLMGMAHYKSGSGTDSYTVGTGWTNDYSFTTNSRDHEYVDHIANPTSGSTLTDSMTVNALTSGVAFVAVIAIGIAAGVASVTAGGTCSANVTQPATSVAAAAGTFSNTAILVSVLATIAGAGSLASSYLISVLASLAGGGTAVADYLLSVLAALTSAGGLTDGSVIQGSNLTAAAGSSISTPADQLMATALLAAVTSLAEIATQLPVIGITEASSLASSVRVSILNTLTATGSIVSSNLIGALSTLAGAGSQAAQYLESVLASLASSGNLNLLSAQNSFSALSGLSTISSPATFQQASPALTAATSVTSKAIANVLMTLAGSGAMTPTLTQIITASLNALGSIASIPQVLWLAVINMASGGTAVPASAQAAPVSVLGSGSAFSSAGQLATVTLPSASSVSISLMQIVTAMLGASASLTANLMQSVKASISGSASLAVSAIQSAASMTFSVLSGFVAAILNGNSVAMFADTSFSELATQGSFTSASGQASVISRLTESAIALATGGTALSNQVQMISPVSLDAISRMLIPSVSQLVSSALAAAGALSSAVTSSVTGAFSGTASLAAKVLGSILASITSTGAVSPGATQQSFVSAVSGSSMSLIPEVVSYGILAMTSAGSAVAVAIQNAISSMRGAGSFTGFSGQSTESSLTASGIIHSVVLLIPAMPTLSSAGALVSGATQAAWSALTSFTFASVPAAVSSFVNLPGTASAIVTGVLKEILHASAAGAKNTWKALGVGRAWRRLRP